LTTDVQVVPSRVRDFYADLGSSKKSSSTSPAHPTTPCGRRTIIRCSKEWLSKGTVNGSDDGVLRMGF
jgi:hypothetical protein